MTATVRNRRARRLARALAVVVSGLLIWVTMGVATYADSPNKLFTATVTTPAGAVMFAGGMYDSSTGTYPSLVVTYVNQYASAPIQAIQLSVPKGITVRNAPVATWTTSTGTSASEGPTVSTIDPTTGYRVVEFDNVYIAKGGPALTVTFGAVAECFPGSSTYDWNARAKQSNSFNGDPGNDFNELVPTTNSISGSCSIKFDAQPADANRNTNITSQAFAPVPPGVKVGIWDGSTGTGAARPVTWWESNIDLTSQNPAPTTPLAGYTSAAPGSTGVAEFILDHTTGTLPAGAGPTLGTSAAGYTLNARTRLLSTTTFSVNNLGDLTTGSTPFVIVDDGMVCATGYCKSHSNTAKLDALVESASGGAGELLVSIAPSTLSTFDCTGYTETTDVVDFTVTTNTRSKTLTVTIYGGLKTQSSNKWQACYRAPYVFTQRSGSLTTLTGGFSVGLLADCSSTSLAPCISARLPNSKTKAMVLVIATPPGDPGVKF